ncbi:MAG: rRNA maturation RNase YbeY [Spirochaetota bacterium]
MKTEKNINISISVIEENRKLPVKMETLYRATIVTFQLTSKKPGDVSLVVCDDKYISNLNERYLHRQGPTDVISFPMREGEFHHISDCLLGDIVISVETAEKQAVEYGSTLEEEFIFLYIHGLLHLLGYTHGTPSRAKEMNEYSRKILTFISPGKVN